MNTNKINNHDFIQSRRDGRVIAFQALFAYDFYERPLEDLIKFDWFEEENDYSAKSLEYAKFLLVGTIKNLETIDNEIKKRLKKWDFSRIAHVDKAILRFSIFSLIFNDTVPGKVIINEAVEIVKMFGAEDSYKFVNGILDAVKRSKESHK